MSAVEVRFESVRDLLIEHNSAVGGKDKPGFVDPERFVSCIKASGGTTEDRLKRMQYEDILQCLPVTDGVKPIALAKDIAKIFRGNDETAVAVKTNDSKPVSDKKAGKMSLEELVQHLDPEEVDNPVGKRLKGIAGDKAFIVYESDRVVNVDQTIKLLKELKAGYPARDVITIGSEIKQVFVLGELPDNFADENPLYPGRPLRPDATCDQLNRSWEGVEKVVRQFVRFAVDHPEGFKDLDIEFCHDALDRCLRLNALQEWKKRYPKVAVDFDQAIKENKAPLLQVALGKPKKEAKGGDKRPFDGGKKVIPQNSLAALKWNSMVAPNFKFEGGSWTYPDYYHKDNNW